MDGGLLRDICLKRIMSHRVLIQRNFIKNMCEREKLFILQLNGVKSNQFIGRESALGANERIPIGNCHMFSEES